MSLSISLTPHTHIHTIADNCNDPNKLIYGYDSMSCMCGKDCTKDGGPDNSGKYRLYIPDPRDPALRLCLAS